HHYDALGSTRQLTDQNGDLTDDYTYDAWGNLVAHTGTSQTAFLWIGEIGYYWNAETKQYTARARIVRSDVARWLSFDPLWFAADDRLNPYRYANGSPMTFVDPSGLSGSSDGGGGDPNMLFPGSCEGCLVLFFLGWKGDPTVVTNGMYIAASVPKSPRHRVVVLNPDDGVPEDTLGEWLDWACSPVRSRAGKTNVCVVLVGHSLGAKVAIETVDWLALEIPRRPACATFVAALLTVDAHDKALRSPVTTGPTHPPARFSFFNYYQDHGRPGLGASGALVKCASISGATNENVNSGLAKWMSDHSLTGPTDTYHTSIEEYIVDSKGVGTWSGNAADDLNDPP
ncbi:MAG: RHS repeat-associated core domain-containing protein, partial [Pirellulales bacterium]